MNSHAQSALTRGSPRKRALGEGAEAGDPGEIPAVPGQRRTPRWQQLPFLCKDARPTQERERSFVGLGLCWDETQTGGGAGEGHFKNPDPQTGSVTGEKVHAQRDPLTHSRSHNKKEKELESGLETFRLQHPCPSC